MAGQRGRASDSIAISVHGPAGVLDLVVPAAATAWDVAREYAVRADIAAIPLIYTRSGTPLAPDRVLADEGLDSGDLLVASPSAVRTGAGERRKPRRQHPPARTSRTTGDLVAAAAVFAAVLVGYLGARVGVSWTSPPVLVLLTAALIGVIPGGRWSASRALAAPAFAAAAAFAVWFDPLPERLPAVLGATALAAAATAAVARALATRADGGLKVWIVTGATVFALTSATLFLHWPAAVSWCLVVLLGMLAARFVPEFAVDVPDVYLLDFDRLAVTAWSARSRPRNRRGQIVVPERFIAGVAERAGGLVEAATLAIMIVVPVASHLLLGVVAESLDRIGARVLVGLSGASLLLVARSYRHPRARAYLRVGGLFSCLALSLDVVGGLSTGKLSLLFGLCLVGAFALVVAAVATGRGWRSPRWSRRAELAESLAGAGAVASVFLASGMFRAVLEWTSRNAPG